MDSIPQSFKAKANGQALGRMSSEKVLNECKTSLFDRTPPARFHIGL